MSPDTTYALDGVLLDDPQGRWFVDSTTSPAPIAGLRSTSIFAAGIEGEVVFANDPFDSAAFSIRINVTDVVPGANPSYAGMQANLDEIKHLFLSRHKLHVLRKTQGGQVREVDARVVTSTTPKELDPRTTQVVFILELPLPVWRDAAPSSWSATVTSTLTTFTVTPLAGATAPCFWGSITPAGTFTTLRVEDEATGRWLEYTRTGTGTQVIDLNTLTARQGTTDTTGSLNFGPGGFALTSADRVTRVRMRRAGGNGAVAFNDIRRGWL